MADPQFGDLPPLPESLVTAGFGLRAQGLEDHAFLRALYGAQRAVEMAQVPWPEVAKVRFLDDQFRHQSDHFAMNNPGADMLVIVRAMPPLATEPIGRFCVDRTSAAWHLMEIALTTAERCHGLGTALVTWLMASCGSAGATGISLHVARDNPRAAALYARLGFETRPAKVESHLRMEWRHPPSRPIAIPGNG